MAPLSLDPVIEPLALAVVGAVPALLDPVSFLPMFRSQSCGSHTGTGLLEYIRVHM